MPKPKVRKRAERDPGPDSDFIQIPGRRVHMSSAYNVIRGMVANLKRAEELDYEVTIHNGKSMFGGTTLTRPEFAEAINDAIDQCIEWLEDRRPKEVPPSRSVQVVESPTTTHTQE
jgi:hypothetical protein